MSNDEWKNFYDENPPPPGLLEIKLQISNFCEYHVLKGNNVVLITSGGTSVPLEHSTVRFVDNFSAGTRGSASAEYFLRSGYAVIFMHRPKTLEPFLRHISVSEVMESCIPDEIGDGPPTISIQGKICNEFIPLIREYKKFQEERMILKLKFTTLSSYLHMLFVAAQAMQPMRQDAILYLAAAVSDFYIPQKDMAVHKIHSDEALNLTLRVVPKMLQPLVRNWIPDAFIVSFKLETNPAILLAKAKGALEKYGHKLVIANELTTRKQKVYFVTKEEVRPITLNEEDVNAGKEIEEKIVAELLKIYLDFKRL